MINFKNNAILGGKTPLIGSILAGIIVGICLLGIIMPHIANAEYANTANASYVVKTTNEAKTIQFGKMQPIWNQTIEVVVTAYSSTPDQTDDTPFITASGKHVAEDIIANNMLPFGTKIRIPKLYGDKVFIVGDRMNRSKSNYHIDLWMPSKVLAVNFGVKTAEIEVLEN